MRLSVIQMDMRLGESAYNFAHAEALLRRAAAEGTDTALLPETWNTGFFPADHLPERSDRGGEAVKALCAPLARELNMNSVRRPQDGPHVPGVLDPVQQGVSPPRQGLRQGLLRLPAEGDDALGRPGRGEVLHQALRYHHDPRSLRQFRELSGVRAEHGLQQLPPPEKDLL